MAIVLVSLLAAHPFAPLTSSTFHSGWGAYWVAERTGVAHTEPVYLCRSPGCQSCL